MIGLIVAAAVLGAAPSDPIEPAKQGLVQCYTPDLARKICRAMGGYAVQADGAILNSAATLVSPSPLIVMRTVAPVRIKAGAICGTVTKVDIDKASFTYDGVPLDGGRATQLRAAVGSAMSPLYGREVCTAFRADGDMLSAEVSLNGVRQPDMDQKVLWVTPSDYMVAQ